MTRDRTLVAPDLLAIMQCPRCAGSLAEDFESSSLICGDCGWAYPVRDGVPNMVVEDVEETEA